MMTTSGIDQQGLAQFLRSVSMDRQSPYTLWTQSTGVPIHQGYYVEDLRTLNLGWWEERRCHAAFLKLAGQEGITEARVTEIAPGAMLPSLKFALDEIVYVVEGNGFSTVSGYKDRQTKTFEWQKHSLFMLPRNVTHQLSNGRGDRPARLLHYNYLPIAMSLVPDPTAYFNNPAPPTLADSLSDELDKAYGEAKIVRPNTKRGGRGGMAFWVGNFFPDMKAWDKLVPFRGRGAGGHAVWIRYPASTMTNHMSVFPSRTYKKAHRHGPGVVIVIPDGEGYSVMWPEGEERVVIPWQEGSVFVPPDRWFHQHFNVGPAPARYLAFHGPPSLSSYGYERVRDSSDQIEYPEEDSWIRRNFEAELTKRGLTSLMPDQAYRDANFQWTYAQDEE